VDVRFPLLRTALSFAFPRARTRFVFGAFRVLAFHSRTWIALVLRHASMAADASSGDDDGRAHVDTYYVTCAPGLEAHLRREWWDALQHVVGASWREEDVTCVFPGGLRATCPTVRRDAMKRALLQFKSADNAYAYVWEDAHVDASQPGGMDAVARVARSDKWKRALELHRHWTRDASHVSTALGSDAEEKTDVDGRRNPTTCVKAWDGDQDEDEDAPAKQIRTFRVTCERTNETMEKHRWTSVQAAAKLGEALLERYPWKVSLEYYELEVMVWVRDRHMVGAVGLLYANRDSERARPCIPRESETTTQYANARDAFVASDSTPSPSREASRRIDPVMKGKCKRQRVDGRKARRNACGRQLYTLVRRYRSALVSTSLRPSVAYCLCQLAGVERHHLLLDPMAGCGTIPLEGHFSLDNRGSMAGDLDADAVQAAHHNGCCLARHHGLSSPDVLRWDARRLPLRGGCVDRVVCDMPFGNICGRVKHRFPLYLSALQEIGRVLCPGTGRALVLLQSRKVHDLLDRVRPSLVPLDVLPLEMNGLKVSMCVLRRPPALSCPPPT